MIQKTNFVIAGTQKGGTTALSAYLRKHPEICMAIKKEVHFFDQEEYFQDNHTNYLIYHSFFSPKKSHIFFGEATPIYMYWYDAPKRIWQYNPEMKIIIILRNPIDRAYSHWNMVRDRKKEHLSFRDAIQHEQNRRREALPYQNRTYSYIDRGFYVEQIRRVWAYFPQGQTLIIKNEDLSREPEATLNKIYQFLGVNSIKIRNIIRAHSRSYPYAMSTQDREYLKYIFEYEVKNLERILGWDCNDWLLN